ncbi:MAG: hypothetical protein JW862_07945 [Anaerolineales bacterium]|nr:hypothetical protein [Anaerolineales bacterium]
MKKIHVMMILLMLVLWLAACNLPVEQTSVPPVDPGLAYTAAAETIIAQVTASAQLTPAPQDDVQGTAPEETEAMAPAASQTSEPSLTPTLTETPTVTASPSPTPVLEAVYYDDFSDQTLWYTQQDERYGFAYGDGGYHITNNILGAAIWSVRGFEYADVGLEVDGTRQGGASDAYYGVACRFSEDGDYYYALVVADNGFYGILKMDEGELEFLGSGTDEAGIIKRGFGETNRVRGVCNGERLALYANDQFLLEVFNADYTFGDVGLVAGNRVSGADLDVLFDNFAILVP